MAGPLTWGRNKAQDLRSRATALLRYGRRHSRVLDHLIRAVVRYQDRSAGMLAGAVTYFLFLSFFPLVALAFAVVGYVVAIYPGAAADLQAAIDAQLPGIGGRLPIRQIADARAGASVFGLLGLLYAGTGAVDALRDALRIIWMHARRAPNFFLTKATDVLALVTLGGTMLASTAITGLATSATTTVLGWVGLTESGFAEVALRIAGVLVGMAADTLIFMIVFSRLSGAVEPFSAFLRGAVLGAAGFAVLKLIGAWLIGLTTGNPVYGAFAVLVGLLVWINITMRYVLFAAAWTATSTTGPAPDPTPAPLPFGPGRGD
ncbi:YihY/virulence factor BrkB family protein [Rhizohabitans arisaemae]|uniref:YihY/virulence factor BrkB family protein n=1 Tax=Rhizohabitans arisaemae TaxID=2720610 RepID=UPI0024B21195|nr:YihY/virulence factor BrkB family protein [Rhizohabitans arisaemae]